MAVRIRLQRHGKKGRPFYHIVVADGRAPRDGRFIEKLGTYNPMTEPATVVLNFDSAVKWLKNGAQPSDTVRSLLSHKGVMLRRHLQIGVEKGAITQEQADSKFNQWMEEKEAKIAGVKTEREQKARDAAKKVHAEEVKKKEAMAQAIAQKNTPAPEVAETPAEEVVEVVEETPAVEETATEETTEA